MPAVAFDPQEFKVIYPQFADFSDLQLSHCFSVATTLIDNSESSRIPYNPPGVGTRKVILYALVCHLCELSLRGGGVVGVLTNATEGSVSSGFSAPSTPGAEWYAQTQCGFLAHQLLKSYTLGVRTYNGCFR